MPAPRAASWMLPSPSVTGAAADFLPLQQGLPRGIGHPPQVEEDTVSSERGCGPHSTLERQVARMFVT